MQKFLTCLIVVLSIIALGVLILSGYGQYLLLTDAALGQSQRFALLPGIAVSTGVLIAAAAFARELRKGETERERHASEVFLEQAAEGFKTVIALLSDGNNSRVLWVRAARTLLKARRMGSQIRSGEYKLAYDLTEEHARNDLYMALTLPNKETGGRDPLPPQFFYGIGDWASCKTLDEAAIKASQRIEAYDVTIDSVAPRASLRPLSTRSVIAIFNFVEYPKTYVDPLDDVPEWGENWDESRDIDQGARRYVAHRRLKEAVGGKLYDVPRR